jgi:uncharacterized protein
VADSAWMQRVEVAVGSLAARSHRRPLVAIALALVVTAVAAYSARGLSLNADLIDLLPRSFQSVQDIDKLKARFGGIGYVVVVGMNGEREKLEQFARDMAPELSKLPNIRFVEFERSAQFFEERGLYYLDLPDLKLVHQRIEDRISWERMQRNPLFIQLDEEPAPSLDFADIEAKYTGNSSRRLAGDGQSYYVDEENKLVVLLLKPRGSSADLGTSRKLVDEVEGFLAKQDLSKYGKDFTWALTGTFKKKLDQQKQIQADLGVASTLAFVLVLLYLAFHFRGVLAVAFALVPTMLGLAWTYGFVGALYGQVNLLTGFLAAILGGLGVEHAIHLLGRYEGARAEGQNSEDATRDTFNHTGGAALISATVAALTFASLAISEFRAFREFGVIAAFGMLAVVLAYLIVLPALIGLATRFGWRPKAARAVTGADSLLARWLPRFFRQVAMISGVIMLLLTVNTGSVRFNYDFAALEDASLPSFRLDHKVNRILGYSQTPVVVLTDTPANERVVVNELLRRKKELGERSTVDFVAAQDDLVPQEQVEKKQVLEEMDKTLARFDPADFEGDQRVALERAKTMVKASPFTRADLPETVRRQFQGIGEIESGFVLVFPGISLADGAKVREFAKEVRSIQLPGGDTLSAAGEAMILADILEMVTREAQPILWAAFLSVIAALWLTLGSIRTALVCLVPTVASILMLVGVMPLVEMPFNYLNIIMIPVLIGVTVDAGVHLVSRLSEAAGERDFARIFGETGRAICGGLLTSAVGFGALLIAEHPGLNSLGQLANLGFATNLVTMLIAFPALLLFIEVRLRRRFTAEALAAASREKAS